MKIQVDDVYIAEQSVVLGDDSLSSKWHYFGVSVIYSCVSTLMGILTMTARLVSIFAKQLIAHQDYHIYAKFNYVHL